MISTIQFNLEQPLGLEESAYILNSRLPQNKEYDVKTMNVYWSKMTQKSIDDYKNWKDSFSGWKIKRYDIINHLIKKYNYFNYLEIGICDGDTFSKINIEHKDGVDPQPLNTEGDRLTNYKIPSDEFFDFIKGHDIKYDIIFVDGLHFDYQVHKDILNSLNHLQPNGTIVCHDMNPMYEVTQMKRGFNGVGMWNGDCWKAWAKLRVENPGLKMSVVDTDHGVGIIQFGQQDLFNINDVDKALFNFMDNSATFPLLEKHRKELLNLISVDDFYKEYEL